MAVTTAQALAAMQKSIDANTAAVGKLTAPVSVTLSDAQFVTLLGKVGTAPVPGSGGTGGDATDYFPADPGNAPFPSPDNSFSGVIGGKIIGKPYLRSKAGAIWEFAKDSSGNPLPSTRKGLAPGYQLSVNGVVNDINCTAMVVGNGVVYFTYDTIQFITAIPDSLLSGAQKAIWPPAGGSTGTGGSGTSAPVTTTDPTPNPIAPGSSTIGTGAPVGSLQSTINVSPAGSTVLGVFGTYHESAGIASPLLITGGGKVNNPGSKDATYTSAAILDATGVDAYFQGQGGFVPMGDCTIKGWEVTKFGVLAGSHDGTGGIRNNDDGVIRIEDCYLHHNQMGIGPHYSVPGGSTLMRLKNVLLSNNGLPQDPGYAHNIYSYATHLIIEGGVTSIAEPDSGDGHPLKFGGPILEIHGKNYFSGWDTSAIDIPHGTAKPFVIDGETVIEKLAGDPNTVIMGYAAESQQNGNAGSAPLVLTIIIPNDGRNYIILTNGPITFASTSKFLYTDGSPVKAGGIVVQGTGTVKGLP